MFLIDSLWFNRGLYSSGYAMVGLFLFVPRIFGGISLLILFIWFFDWLPVAPLYILIYDFLIFEIFYYYRMNEFKR